MNRVVIIGDLHGQFEKTMQLWDRLKTFIGNEEFTQLPIVFLGDYCDRGPQTKEIFDWLIHLKETRPNTYFIAGNHDHALALFLGLFDAPDGFSMKTTWEFAEPKQKREKEGWWTGTTEAETNSMHLQGRRYGGEFPYVGWGDSIMNSAACFDSYGCKMGDRAKMLEAVPDSHKTFLRELPWCLRMPMSDGSTLLFVHAGLEQEGWQEQLKTLEERDVRPARLETLSGRKNVLHCPEELMEQNTVLISGHHGIVGTGKNRVILDSSGGKWQNPLSAMIWPDKLVFRHDDEDPTPLEEVAKDLDS